MGAEIMKEMIRSVVDSGAAWFMGAGASATAFCVLLFNKIAGH